MFSYPCWRSVCISLYWPIRTLSSILLLIVQLFKHFDTYNITHLIQNWLINEKSIRISLPFTLVAPDSQIDLHFICFCDNLVSTWTIIIIVMTLDTQHVELYFITHSMVCFRNYCFHGIFKWNFRKRLVQLRFTFQLLCLLRRSWRSFVEMWSKRWLKRFKIRKPRHFQVHSRLFNFPIPFCRPKVFFLDIHRYPFKNSNHINSFAYFSLTFSIQSHLPNPIQWKCYRLISIGKRVKQHWSNQSMAADITQIPFVFVLYF